MRRIISCRTLVPGCAFVAHSRDGAQVVRLLTEHMSMIHGLDPLPGDLQARVHGCVEAHSSGAHPHAHA